MSRIDIAYIVSHGFAARMVMQTNLLGRLVDKGLNVALIVPDETDQNLLDYCKTAKVTLFEFNQKNDFWSHQHAESRKYFLEDLDQNPALLEKHIWATKYNPSKNAIGQLRPRILYMVYRMVKYIPSIRTWYKRREKKHLESSDAEALLNKINPKIIISTYPVNFTEAMLLRAGNNRKDTKTMIHLLSWDNISCKGFFPELAQDYIAWGQIMKDEFIEYYKIPQNKIHICGVPHFDLHTESLKNPDSQHLVKLGLDAQKPYLFFAMSSPRFAPCEIDIVEWLSIVISKDVFGDDLQMVVRPHPQNVQGSMADISWIPRLKALQTSRVRVDFPELSMESKMSFSMQAHDMIKFSQLLAGSLLCLNSGSTVSIDALVCQKPGILTSFDGKDKLEFWKSARRLISYTHLKKMVETKGVTAVSNYEELTSEIQAFLRDKNRNITEREMLLKMQCTNEETSATENVVKLLSNACNEG